jgi:cell division protein ZapA
MAEEAKPINVQILDKDYLVGCAEEERSALVNAAKFLDARMREVRDSGKVIGTERIAVITALNIAHEFLQNKSSLDTYSASIDAEMQRLTARIDEALRGDKAPQTS